jgi:hypothetical protein
LAVFAVVLAPVGSDGVTPSRAAPPAPQSSPSLAAPTVLATGLTELNAQLLWSPEARPQSPVGFGEWRDRVDALRPAYLRVLVDWSKLQPDPAKPPDLAHPADGCLRGAPPCAPYRGLSELMEAVASQQRAHPGAFEPVVTIYGVPQWAAAPASGCERSDASPRARPITGAGLDGYRALIRALLDAGRQAGLTLRWWSPWNEPNHPAFVSPQRDRCDASAPSRAPAVYTTLVRTAKAELDAAPGDQQLLLGELSGVTTPTPRSTAVAEFVDALPDDVVCAGRTWAQHMYAVPGADQAGGADPVGVLEAALDRRPCSRGAHIWITETGVGGPDPGGPRPQAPDALAAGCAAADGLLRRWAADPRVDAAFQYTFREDTAYPVGLVDAGLHRTYPTYDLWLAWGGTRLATDPPPVPPAGCGATG